MPEAGYTFNRAALSPSAGWLAAYGYNFESDAARLWVWEVPPSAGDAVPAPVLRHSLTVLGRVNGAVAFHPDESQVAVSSSDGARNVAEVFRLTDGTALAQLNHSAFPADLAYSPDGTVLAVASTDARIALWNASTYASEGVLEAYNPGETLGGLAMVRFSPDGSELVYAGNYPVLQVWDLATQTEARTKTLPDDGNLPLDLAFSADGEVLLVAAGSEFLGTGSLYAVEYEGVGLTLLTLDLFTTQIEVTEEGYLFAFPAERWLVYGVAP
ncbi:MAG: hypothetical protein HC915_19745 [Anaerolineae bacterium]|nr:hypothetical protein [Anaerolineae bacterium]